MSLDDTPFFIIYTCEGDKIFPLSFANLNLFHPARVSHQVGSRHSCPIIFNIEEWTTLIGHY